MMKHIPKLLNVLLAFSLVLGPLGFLHGLAFANTTAQTLPFSQDWTDGSLIVTNDDWSLVPGIMGYLGTDLTAANDVDPQTVLAPDDPGIPDVIANQTNPNTLTAGGVAEFAITDPAVALQGSGTADAPYLKIAINTTGMTAIQVSYDLRDLESGADNAAQQVAMHYRIGSSGSFTNVPAAYVADATIQNATMTTHVSVTLPAAVDNAELVQLRIMTTNATGSDEWVGVDNISITGTPVAGDTAPYVASTSPANGGEIAANDNIVITFSEPVTLGSNWFDITCTTSSTHTAVVTDGDPVYTLNPDNDFTAGESCTVNIYADFVTDEDDPPDTMESNYAFTFSVAYGCGDPFTAIPAIQGNGTSSPIVGNVVSTEGIVTADYQTDAYVSGTKNGFFMQSASGDGDPATSEGLFIYSTLTDVHVGDHVRVTGTVKEQFNLTELSPVTQILVCSSGNSVEPTEFSLPAATMLDFEKFEGMYVTIPQELTIVEYYNFDQFGEIVLGTERFMQFTAVNEPDPTGFAAWNADLALNSILLDDGREASNPDPARHPNGSPFTLENLFRGGDKLTNVIGVMDYNFSKYRIQPTAGADYESMNPRTLAPDVDEVPGSLKVASFNVLNYFTTIDTGAFICSPSGTMECRGADTAEELTRQRNKILAALLVIDADVVGVMEIENDRPLGPSELPDYAVADLVVGLNDAVGEGTYAYIATGAIGTDAIKQAIIYKPAAVTPVGGYQLLTSAVDSRFIDTLNRPALAQVFADNRTGESFVVAVNHLKSKGSACPDDPDLLDGAGNCNLTRKAAAQALVDWLANPGYFPDMENALIIGDLNSYDYEDPIDMIKLGSDDEADTDDDYYDVLKEFRGEEAYGYLYGSQLGYLDYALVNTHLVDYLLDVNFWNINADESDLINYDMTYKLPAQDAIYAPDAYRSSDHDPVILTLLFNTAPVANNMTVETPEDTPLDFGLNVSDDEGNELEVTILTGPLHGSLDVLGTSVTYTPHGDYNGEDSFTYMVNDWELDSDEATVTITVTPVNDAPVAVGATYDLPENSYVMFALGVIEVDGDPLSYIIVTEPAHGSLVCVGGDCTYTPDPGWYGEDSLTFKANDGTVDSNEAVVSFRVAALPRIYLPIAFK